MDTKLLLVLAIMGTIIGTVSMRLGYLWPNNMVQVALVTVFLSIVFKFHRKLYIIFKTLPRDITFFIRLIKASRFTRHVVRNNMTIVKLFRERVKLYPTEPCFIYEDTTWTTADVNRYSNQIASVFQKAGYKKGDTVALMMPNRPEYVATWLGLAKLGVITALVNTNLRHQSLIHCLTVAKVKAFIYAEDYSTAIDDISESLSGIARYKYTDKPAACDNGVYNLKQLLLEASFDEPVVDKEPGYRDVLLYIYTSGTTGLPKVVVFPNSRYLLVVAATYYMVNLKTADILYNSIPMYHMSGGIVGTCCALAKGIPSVLKQKFSASAYWVDCVKYKCTVALYIGEICRYLLNTKSCPEESLHSLRLMLGNGMRPQIWREFMERFGIKTITEIYGSSEGNANIINIDNKIGAIGVIPSILPKRLHPVAIIRVNQETLEPIRGSDGLCIRADINEPGMFIGLIKRGDASREFNGYLDKEASEKKIIQNVFAKGDRAFVTGDLLVHDELGYFYFKDRVGDTFRWKGENVATTEVEAVISTLTENKNCSVYGVEVPGTEGKAGMAAIADPNNLLDLKKLAEGLDISLPSYAKPIFLRIVKEVEITGTFKLKKYNLQKEGFNPNAIKDKLYIRIGQQYVHLTPEIYEEILMESRRL